METCKEAGWTKARDRKVKCKPQNKWFAQECETEKKIDHKLTQSCTPKEKDACSHLLFLISIGRTTHVTRNMCYMGGEKTYHYVYVLCK